MYPSPSRSIPEHPGLGGPQPAGAVEVVHRGQNTCQTKLIERIGNELRLKFIAQESNEWQSRIDLGRPEELLSPYMQVLTMALLWQDPPQSVHVLGLGGGMIPMFLRRNFPDMRIDCTEIDPEVVDLAHRYFGFRGDDRMNVVVGDGRDFLARRSGHDPYSAIIVDAFRGIGCSPLRLATREFLNECRAQLHPEGVLAVNILPNGALVAERVATLRETFRSVHIYAGNGALVAFASASAPLPLGELAARGRKMEAGKSFGFPFSAIAECLLPVGLSDLADRNRQAAIILSDATPPETIQIPAHLLAHIARNDDCPCGSGRKFKKCHGRS